jgi:uncharacterized repeat protein (TIGR03943 family)
MTDRIVRWTTAVVALFVFVVLVAAAVTGDIRTILNPRILPRTLIGAGAFAVAATAWAIAGLRSPGALRWGAIAPLVVPLILLPAALESTSGDYSRIRLFTAGGSGAVANLTPEHGIPTVSSRGDRDIPGDSWVDDGSWVDDANPDLLAAVDAAAAETATGAPGTPGSSFLTDGASAPERRAEISALAAGTEPIEIGTDTFTRRINLIWDDPAAFRDRQVRVTGFVYRRDDWPMDTFVVARLSIWCCVADAAVVGLPARVDRGVSAPPTGEWIEIEGRVEVRPEFVTETVSMSNVPQLRDPQWHRIDPPRHEYVFPE